MSEHNHNTETAPRSQNARRYARSERFMSLPRHPQHPKWRHIQSYEQVLDLLQMTRLETSGMGFYQVVKLLADRTPVPIIYEAPHWREKLFLKRDVLKIQRKEARKGRRRVVVSTYDVSRCYGGPEEGGWWYDWYEHVRSSRPMKRARAFAIVAALLERRKRRYSVNGGSDRETFVEDYGGKNISREVPHYE